MAAGIVYREAFKEDQGKLYPLAKSLATSFEVNSGDFSCVFNALLKDANTDLLVAEKEQEIIGYVFVLHHPAFYANGIISWVEELFVLEEYRGHGIGKSLMEEAEKKSKARGAKLMALATRRADKFYKAIGYSESATYFKKNFV
ncbi:GNAT family N-acetyltransferase [Planococcus sp. CP5-4]|uniref:GNAT family N-acetyltransferase n=1 Tax=unclassified Planococcus (in: firmicutes) TaxID=2662419 RepID=UPI001C23F5BF|nr:MULTISPECIES: GNAT family N-acetyltransferase [unclassified Planococcus (in: firmicutes)]MBU9675150.1 GNAT family N-acetyltransferase [Planococcus sp. CP5-4_YE]MBV0910683.1 GNAT family N-acetyltransferase [Planococcus sp. CP5-4_UN]MBW6065465.1 GNAT family N-acetyltransferase [Planococcus sp. CP5-4]